jgi:hypothetical protein
LLVVLALWHCQLLLLLLLRLSVELYGRQQAACAAQVHECPLC